MNIGIVEDEQIHRELLVSLLREWGQKRNHIIQISDFCHAESFLFEWEELPEFDILFIDIQMNQMNGMELARKIREKNEQVAIVFTTGISDYLEEGYEVNALHYLLKPLKKEKVFQCMDKVQVQEKKDTYIVLNDVFQSVCKVPVSKIMYVEARGHGSIVALEGNQKIEVTESLSDLEKRLQEGSFVKTHRSYICNLKKIYRIDKSDIYLDDGSKIPVSRRLYQTVNKEFIRFFCDRKVLTM